MAQFSFRAVSQSHVAEVFLGVQFIGLVRQVAPSEWRADRRAFASREEAARWLAGVAR